MLAAPVLRRVITKGSLTVIGPDGSQTVFGDGSANPGSATIRIHDRATERRMLINPHMALGEAYMEGTLTCEDGTTLPDLLDLIGENLGRGYGPGMARVLHQLRMLKRRIMQYNPVHRARRNVAHHYDLSGELYDLFLDADRQYSCAYFLSPGDSIEAAQHQKKDHIAAKLLLEPGQRVLDIGSGWGGLGLHIARLADVQVQGVTLSEEQHKLSNARAEAGGLADRVRFDLIDYRHLQGTFDRVVSVGMFEHVGVNHYREYFDRIAELLNDDGVALIHSIGRSDGPGVTNPWIAKYIFPGGYIPALSEVLPYIERSGLWVTDVEILRLHYAETLKAWYDRFMARREEAARIYDERFCRMWEFYLAGSEMSFRHGGMMVFQVQLAKRQDAVPLTRDYITDAERGFAARATPERARTVA
ncbi:MAG: cyclopropane-fatty-acyl-phospholipid synthase family protein [Alphaproteobacteria bacterium]|nr:cyclopropane-fatty-acyl-phospholipid synthase family protein [Alphaproteobacteria bacterium]MDX5368391.1 cyclopropane-fatty-acyl-phospholipid synthase family protein [Alphaproteobacteria bacterium]MDX5463186.1 cyclopropane-fatty-acyl-phospholipid synthase family protein [Alphaproteobacteria bacterium]